MSSGVCEWSDNACVSACAAVAAAAAAGSRVHQLMRMTETDELIIGDQQWQTRQTVDRRSTRQDYDKTATRWTVASSTDHQPWLMERNWREVGRPPTTSVTVKNIRNIIKYCKNSTNHRFGFWQLILQSQWHFSSVNSCGRLSWLVSAFERTIK